MKFKQYLTEAEDNTDEAIRIINLIKKDCKPYLKQLNIVNFLRGKLLLSGRDINKNFSAAKVRQNRKPKDTPPEIHDFLDN